MNSKKSGGKVYLDSSASSQYGNSSGGPASANTSPKVDLQIHGVADATAKSAQDGQWEVFAKKSKNRNNNTTAKPRGASVAPPKVGSHQDVHGKNMDNNGGKGKVSSNSWHTPALDPRRVAGRANMNTRPPHSGRALESAIKNPPPALAPPLQSGWQWAARRGTANTSQSRDPTGAQGSTGQDFGSNADYNQLDDESDDDELVDDSDDDILSDNYDSDVSQKSHETRKKGKWFKSFFELLDGLTTEQLNEATREWHCPACQDGPGAIDWYKGLQPLMTHAKTKGSTRMKLHRELAELLEEELLRRGTSVIPAGEAFGKWRGLRTTTTDHEIVWPPMVIIRNTILEQDEKEKWIGMGNQELLDYFDSYQAAKARHSYGPQGHRGISVLIFESTAVGYLEAERLHKHFAEQGTDRDAWDRHRVLFYPGGKRQLYGYMATKEDLDYFNQHSQGKARLKFEVKSYQEMVVGPMKQMSEDNQQLIWLKNKVAKQKQHSKVLQETMGVMSNQLRIATEENRIVRLRTKLQHEENKEEMDYMEQFFKEKMAVIHEALEEKEQAFEKALQEERAKASDNADLGSSEDRKHRREEIVRFIDSQSKGIEDFEKEREKLIKIHDEKKTEMKRQHYEEEVELEKEFDAALTELMEAYSPHPAQPSASS